MLYDFLVWLGRGIGLPEYQASDLKSLGRMMDKYGVARALLHSFAARELDIFHGNELVFAAAAADPRLIPCPAVLPNSGLEAGANRVLFGSDTPWMTFSQQIGRILFTDIKDEEKHQVLVENPGRLHLWRDRPPA